MMMPNLSPKSVRAKYLLYDNKICTGEEAAECIRCLTERIERAGYRDAVSRGDHIGFEKAETPAPEKDILKAQP